MGKKSGSKIAEKLYEWLDKLPKRPNWLLHSSNVREDLLALEPAADATQKQKEYVISKLSLCGMILVVGVLLSFLVWIKDAGTNQIVDNRLYREAHGDGDRSIRLTAQSGEEKAYFQLNLAERRLTTQELEQLYEEFVPLLERAILGRNESLDCVTYDLVLISSLEGYPFSVDWLVPEAYLDSKGKLLKEELEEPVTVELTAKISCDVFDREYSFGCCIYNRAEFFGMEEKLSKELIEVEESGREQEYMTLPSQFHDKEVIWSIRREHTGLLLLIMTPVIMIAVYWGKDRDLHNQTRLKAEQMQADYPEIVSKLSLLISAGMTVQGAWNRVAGDYLSQRKQSGNKRYAYEEMLLTIHEMENGYSMRTALERFGKRCKNAGYTRFSALLAQNLTKGGANLSTLLQAEARQAFEERKHAARKLGEKAGTKLLVPMTLLLGIVMVIVIVPALTIN